MIAIQGKMVENADGMVYEMPNGSVIYFQDRHQKYPFQAGPEALSLLRRLLDTNTKILQINRTLVEATANIQTTLEEGRTLYADKPTMKQHDGALGTWSNDEYAHPGFQCEYLKYKSFQRFTESWALYERAARRGILDRYVAKEKDSSSFSHEDNTLHVVSLGGGPGFELLAFEWFLEYWVSTRGMSAPEAIAWLCRAHNRRRRREESNTTRRSEEDALLAATQACSITDDDASIKIPQLKLASLDLQPTWEPYVRGLPGRDSKAQYSFAPYNIKEGIHAVECSGFPRIDLCLISNLLVYCSDEPTADVLTDLLTTHGVHAILVNERGTEQKLIPMLERREVVVVRLMDQTCGIQDDRQLLLLPPGSTSSLSSHREADKTQDVRAQRNGVVVFPNVPFEEHKHAMAQQHPSSSHRRRKLPGFAS